MHSHLGHRPRSHRTRFPHWHVNWAVPSHIYHHTSPANVGSHDHPRPKTTRKTSFPIWSQGGHRNRRPNYICGRTGTSRGSCLQTFTITVAHYRLSIVTTHVRKSLGACIFQYGHTLSRRPPARQAQIYWSPHWHVT